MNTMETIYIYPHGITSKILGAMIACVRDVKLCFIDDSNQETSLEAHAETLRKNRAVVLVARSPYNQTADKLIAKLQKEQILYRDNAVDEAALEVIAKINATLHAKKWKTTIAIEITGLEDDKHIGTIDQELLQYSSDVCLLYLCSLPESFEKISQSIKGKDNCLAFCLPCFYFYLLDCVQALVKTSMFYAAKNSSVPTFYLAHALVDWKNYDQAMLDSLKESYDYACVAGVDFLPQHYNDSYLPSGYLGFDRIAHALPSPLVLPPPPRKIILFCPYNMNEMWKMFGFAKAALKHYDVCFRIRYRNVGEPSSHWDNEGMEQILAQLLQYPNFSIDENEQITTQTYLETFCCVCGATTMRYTYPLLALRPSIALADNPRALPRALGVVLDTNADMEFMEIVHGIYAAQQTWHESLLRYREQKIYHFGGASTWLAKFILQRLGLLQNARL